MFSVKTFFDVFLSILTVVPGTLVLALVIMTLAIILGMVIGLLRANRVPVLNRLAILFVSFMRGTPLLVQLYIVYYSLPGIITYAAGMAGHHIDPNNVSPIFSVICAYSLCQAAFQSENIRGAMSSVEYGQLEAGYSVGLTTFQVYKRVVFPQAMMVAIPSFCNGYVSTIKSLSLAFTVSVIDILAKAKLCSALNFRYIESYAAAALVYWALCITLTRIFYRFEKHLIKGRALITS